MLVKTVKESLKGQNTRGRAFFLLSKLLSALIIIRSETHEIIAVAYSLHYIPKAD